VPNFSEWQLGDIVLVASDGSLGSRLVTTAQATSRNALVREAARFTHAAVYVGDGMLIDAAVQDGVLRRSVWHYCQRRALTLRRLPSTAIPDADVADIAKAATRHLGEAYSLSAAVFSKLIPATQPDPQRLFCSTFVGLVVTEATGLSLTASREHRPLHPATLAVHPELQAVSLEWRPMPAG
jgi:Permuted papain-like amidase enzyme, YaeF/YiiX, C92 family